MTLAWIVMIAAYGYINPSVASQNVFIESRLSDVVFEDDVISNTPVSSEVNCGRKCSQNPSCAAFTFVGMTSGQLVGHCMMYSTTMTSLRSKDIAIGARTYLRTLPDVIPKTCAEAVLLGFGTRGLWTLNLTSLTSPTPVFCEGDWLVILRRVTNDVEFYRDWVDYVTGFGDLYSSFWFGLEKIHLLTSQKDHNLRVVLKDWDDVTASADYSNFRLGSDSDNYTLHFDGYLGGDAGNALLYHNGSPFSTKDADHDEFHSSCAQRFQGAWWFKSCHSAHLSGPYLDSGPADHGKGIQWRHWKGQEYSLKFAMMMIKPDV